MSARFDEVPPTSADRPVPAADTLLQQTRPSAPGSTVVCSGNAPRYRTVRLHALGGLGEVHVAEDTVLGRTIALKRIRPGRADDADCRQRFRGEAEIAARLEHPGIVPIYDYVLDDGGQPGYVMRFIEGQTLLEAISTLHERGQGRLPLDLEFRQLLHHFVAACHAVAYAHSRGVLHRDLKPSNILLGKFGETLVVDWGLAKVVGVQEAARVDGATTLPRPTEPVAGGTELGATVGTPAFMSPEQAAGRWDAVGPTSDVYGLGATLYQLLTNEPPYQGLNTPHVLMQVIQGACQRPRQLKPDIPVALEAICRKAMAREPEARYPTARELGADVERWLADEPVMAWPEPWLVRLRRWRNRHRQTVTAATAAVVVALVSLAVLNLLLGAANIREQQAKALAEQNARDAAQQRDEAQQQRDKAEAHYKLAHDAVDRYYSQVSENRLFDEPGLQPLRKELLKTGLGFYQKFVQESQNEPGAALDLGKAYLRLGDITQLIDSRPQAITYFRQAQVIFEKLVQGSPQEPAYQRELATTCDRLGVLYLATDEAELSRKCFAQAHALRTQLDGDREGKAHGLFLQGLSHYAEGNKAKGIAMIQEGLALFEKLVREHPQVPGHQQSLALSYAALGTSYQSDGKFTEAEAALRQADAHARKLAKDYPKVLHYRFMAAHSPFLFAELYRRQGRMAEAKTALRESLTTYAPLIASNPTVIEYRNGMGMAQHRLGEVCHALQQTAEAEAAFHQAQTVYESLAREHPAEPRFALALARSWGAWADLLRDVGRFEEALKHYARSIAILESIVAKHPSNANATDMLGNHYKARAAGMMNKGRYAEALKDWDRALPHAVTANRTYMQVQRMVALANLGEHASAVQAADAVAETGHLSAEHLYDLACVYALASAAVRKDARLPTTDRDRAAEAHASRAVAVLQRAIDQGYQDVQNLKEDADLASLRSRADFKQLIGKLDAKKE